MNEKQNYIATADGWIGRKRIAKGDPIELAANDAQYENVILASDADAKVELTGSLDDPLVKSSGLSAKAKSETAKRGRAKK